MNAKLKHIIYLNIIKAYSDSVFPHWCTHWQGSPISLFTYSHFPSAELLVIFLDFWLQFLQAESHVCIDVNILCTWDMVSPYHCSCTYSKSAIDNEHFSSVTFPICLRGFKYCTVFTRIMFTHFCLFSHKKCMKKLCEEFLGGVVLGVTFNLGPEMGILLINMKWNVLAL